MSSTPIPRSMASSSSCRCRRRSTSRSSSPAFRPDKDVDGFHPVNAGRLAIGLHGFVPCTPLGCLMLLKQQLGDLSGLDAIVVGRSNIVGKPMALLLLRESCTVTVAHSRTRDLPAAVKRADIVVAAVGRPELIRGDWLKPGATVIDVGQERVEQPDGTRKLLGDVAFDEAVRSRRRDHAGPRRRRADDHRLPDPQHLRFRRPPRRLILREIAMILALLLAASSPSVVDAENAFARDAQRLGQWTAFRPLCRHATR